MPPRRKRPDIKSELSTASEELTELEQLEELWSDVVREDSDVFIPSATNTRFRLILDIARARANEGVRRTAAIVEQDIRKVVRARHHLRDGLTGIRLRLAERLQRCEQILSSGVDQEAPKRPVNAGRSKRVLPRAIFNNRYVRLFQQSPNAVSRDKRPVLELAQQLVRLDQLLMCLESPESNRPTDQQDGLDLAAFVGSAICYGIAIGGAAAEMRFHQELARDAQATRDRGSGGKNTSFRSKCLRGFAEQLISDAFRRRYEVGDKWKRAYEQANVPVARAQRLGLARSTNKTDADERPSTKTVERMVLQEIERLIAEIGYKMRTGTMSVQDACRAVANDRNNLGYSLQAAWLEKLIEERRKEKTRGQRSDPIGELLADRMGKKSMSKKMKKYFREIERDHKLGRAQLIDAAFYAYSKEE